jgi:hypothetical protein
MAEGLGFKTFTTGEVLTAADVNGYLMQGVLVFASEAARDAAITSPQEGQFAFTKDNNSLWYYSGAAWVASGATGDIEGVTAGTGISGGGTSGTVTITNSMATAIDAKADLVVGTGADTFSVLAVGANGTVLTAASGEATGLEWAAPAGAPSPNFALINAGGTALTGAATITVNVSGKNELFIFAQGASTASGGRLAIRLNADSGSNYNWTHFSATNDVTLGTNAAFPSSYFNVGDTVGNTGTMGVFAQFSGTNAAGIKPVAYGSVAETGSGRISVNGQGYYAGTSVITSVSLVSDGGGNFDAGTIYVYGA